MSASNQQKLIWLLAGVIILLGVALRGARIDDRPLWVDEAESSINGLTILEHGVPVDHYLGQPIYENVMHRQWPESDEYEFRDLSYSNRGLAVYHGWLPLYSIALAEWTFGVQLDNPNSPPSAARDLSSIERRTWVPRLPSLVYSAIFLFVLFATARSMAGDAAGFAALVFAAFGEQFVWFGYQARYYSATLCFDAVCAWFLWRCVRRGLLADFIGFGCSLVLLFHTHALSSAAVLTTAFLVLPMMRRHEQLLWKVSAAAGVFLLGVAPWAWFSGLIGHAQKLPLARELMIWPDDLLYFATQRVDALALLAICILSVLLLRWINRRTQTFEDDDVTRMEQAGTLCAAWLCVAYGLFFAIMPAASFFWVRMTMTLETPAVLLIASGLSAAAQILFRKHAPFATTAVVVVFLVGTGRFVDISSPKVRTFEPVVEVLQALHEEADDHGARLYSAPNFHLVYSYYSGLPVQSVAPVRKRFLDTYPGKIVLVFPYMFLNGREMESAIRDAADHARDDADADALREWKRRLNRRLFFERLEPRVASFNEAPEIPEFLLPALDACREMLKSNESPPWVEAECPVMMRGFSIHTFEQWWTYFFYRFVSPEDRLEEKANYADRIKSGRMLLLPSGNAVCVAPPLRELTSSKHVTSTPE